MSETRTTSYSRRGVVEAVRWLLLTTLALLPFGCGGGTYGTGTNDGTRALVVFVNVNQQPIADFEFTVTGSTEIYVSNGEGEAEIDLQTDLPYTAVRFTDGGGTPAATYLKNSEAELTPDAIPVMVINPGEIPPSGSPASVIQCEDALPFWQGLAGDSNSQDELGLSVDEVGEIDRIANGTAGACGDKMRSIEAIAFQ